MVYYRTCRLSKLGGDSVMVQRYGVEADGFRQISGIRWIGTVRIVATVSDLFINNPGIALSNG